MATMTNGIGKAPSDDLLNVSVSSSPQPFLVWQKELRECIDTEDFSQAVQVLLRKGLKESLLGGFFDESIRNLLKEGITYRGNPGAEDSPMQKLIRTAEFLNYRGLGSSFSRLGQAAAYCELEQHSKLEALIGEICLPRGPNEPSDLYKLKEGFLLTESKALVTNYFTPLHTAILHHLDSARQPFPIGKVAEKV